MSAAVFPRGVPVAKRLFDLLLTIPGLVLIWPLLGVLALAIRWRLGSPVLFQQLRPGVRGKGFRLYKFRTMSEVRGPDGSLLPDDVRLTGLGRWLRSFSLDELPELINVVRGEMSLVGPRPLLMAYLERYTPEQARRHEVLPGLTGWAQVNGRNAITWEQRFALDVWYVDHWSLVLDAKILAITLLKAVRREGINPPGQATSPEFMGSTEKGR
ncbi:MAG TPA: sugar transferase [Anaerolineales bacterium]|nr:sugar transferase [Anaerolineales bacterium]